MAKIKLITQKDIYKEMLRILELDLDYELATLYDALETDDKKQIKKSKKRLNEIRKEMSSVNKDLKELK